MRVTPLHDWPISIEEARLIQETFRHRVITSNRLRKVRYVAGIDIGFEKEGAITRAAIAVLTFPALELAEQHVVRDRTRFPYVPGYLSFREVPAALKAFAKLDITPDLLLCDGQGMAHPRRFGLACHLGLWTGLPSIGVAKSRLIGTHKDVAVEKGSWQALLDDNEVIGAVVRTRTKVKPVYVSIGHMVDLPTAIDYTLRCTPKYRLPETTRWAHKLASG
ncbi:MAG: deoxyribonuclease V [Gammaproteobacteria bacterium]|nr:deoxyribonuclease V [Gammaproteobacteria bacterium]